jgi:hypothetical protein
MVAIESIYMVMVLSGGSALITTVAAAISAIKLLPSERTVPPSKKNWGVRACGYVYAIARVLGFSLSCLC